MNRIATTLPYTELEVATGNYDTSRSPIDRIIIHTMVGNWQGAAARFDDPSSQVSAHYGVKLDGGLIHWLEETYTAYHAGDYTMNQRSIGIEHEDGGDFNGVRPDVLYASSAKLVRDICQFYNIPIDRQHIFKHSEVSDAPTGCPDALDIDRIVREANDIDPLQACLTQHETLVVLCNQKDATIDQLKQANSSQSEEIKTLQGKITDLEGQVTSLDETISKYKSDALSYEDEIEKTNELYQERVKADKQAIEDGITAQTNFKQEILSRSTLAINLDCKNDWDSIELAVKTLQNNLSLSKKQAEDQLKGFSKYLKLFIDIFVRKKK